MSDRNSGAQLPEGSDLQQSSGFIVGTGVLLLLMGLFAMNAPFIAGISLALMVGIALIVGGVSQLFYAFRTSEGLLAIVLAILTIAIGGYMVSRPGAALGSLTLFLALYLIISGFIEAIMSLGFRPNKGWGFILMNGILSMVLGGMIWSQFPVSGVWAIGILIGVRLFFNGATLLTLGLSAGR